MVNYSVVNNWSRDILNILNNFLASLTGIFFSYKDRCFITVFNLQLAIIFSIFSILLQGVIFVLSKSSDNGIEKIELLIVEII